LSPDEFSGGVSGVFIRTAVKPS